MKRYQVWDAQINRLLFESDNYETAANMFFVYLDVDTARRAGCQVNQLTDKVREIYEEGYIALTDRECGGRAMSVVI